jgi:hypothetical protein
VKKNIKIMMILFALLPFWLCNGYFYQAHVMKKLVDKEKKMYQLVIGLGDYHDKSHPANKDQRTALEDILKKVSTQKAKCIVEDLSSVNNDGKMMCCNYSINAQGGMLGRLADTARSLQKNVDNVEYRYCRVASLGPLLTNIGSQPHLFKSSASIMIHSLYQEVLDEINRIKRYNDGKILNSVYKYTINNVHNALARLSLNPQKNISVADYCSGLPQKQYAKDLENLCIFDSALIDMKMMHSIVNAHDTSLVIAVEGLILNIYALYWSVLGMILFLPYPAIHLLLILWKVY